MTTETPEAPAVCPSCGGKGQIFAFQNTGEDYRRHRQGDIPCFRCNGSGTITAEQLQRIEYGRQLREARIARKETLMDASRRCGLTPAQISAIEHGRGPTVAEAKALAGANDQHNRPASAGPG